MEDVLALRRLAGGALVAGAIGFALAGALHPTASAGSLREATISILRDPIWPYPHWIGLVTMLVLATTAWLLVDAAVTRGSAVAQAGARVTIVASLFMAVQSAAEVAAPSELEALAAGEPAPLIALIEAMQAVGWPAFAAGWILLAVGCGRRLAPRPVVALAVVGAAALGIAGVLVEGIGVVSAAPLFQATALLTIWLLWAGLRLSLARGAEFVEASRPATVSEGMSAL
jgi:hypothetical protein